MKPVCCPFEERTSLHHQSIIATERFTQHPPRYTEASLVRKLEELGIGRPSTYALPFQPYSNAAMWRKAKERGRALLQHTFIAGQQDYGRYANRNYRSRKAKLMPTDTGTVVNDSLMEYFPNILDYNFTASVEKRFDEIAEGEKVDRHPEGFL